jgi:hypothetical protein
MAVTRGMSESDYYMKTEQHTNVLFELKSASSERNKPVRSHGSLSFGHLLHSDFLRSAFDACIS